jgi:hypothetical protein
MDSINFAIEYEEGDNFDGFRIVTRDKHLTIDYCTSYDDAVAIIRILDLYLEKVGK